MTTPRPDLLKDRLDEMASGPSRDVIVDARAAWHEGSRRRSRRRVRIVAASLVVAVVGGLGLTSILGQQPSVSPAGDISSEEIAFATTAALQELARQENREATVTSATVVAKDGTVTASNTGSTCASGRILVVKLIGTFPGIVTSGLADRDGAGSTDTDVHAVLVTVDAVSGATCLIGVQTGDVAPAPGSTALVLDSRPTG